MFQVNFSRLVWRICNSQRAAEFGLFVAGLIVLFCLMMAASHPTFVGQ